MKSISINLRSIDLKTIFLDIFAIALIYFIPTLSHLTQLPIYFVEPMRLMLILSLVNGNKTNAYLLALSLPLFSFVVSGHPVLPKMLLISSELIINVFLFYFLSKKLKSVFPAILISIVASKAVYYVFALLLVNFTTVSFGLASSPIFIQAIVTVVFSGYLWLALRNKNES